MRESGGGEVARQTAADRVCTASRLRLRLRWQARTHRVRSRSEFILFLVRDGGGGGGDGERGLCGARGSVGVLVVRLLQPSGLTLIRED